MKIDLKALDLFIDLPQRETPFAAEHKWNQYPFANLDVDGTHKAAASIADRVSNSQNQPLQFLTLHISRMVYCDIRGSVHKEAKMQLRRTDRDDAHTLGINKYKVIKKCQWRDNEKVSEMWSPDDLRVFDLPRE